MAKETRRGRQLCKLIDKTWQTQVEGSLRNEREKEKAILLRYTSSFAKASSFASATEDKTKDEMKENTIGLA